MPAADPLQTAERLHAAAIALLRCVRAADAATGLSAARLSALSVLVFGGPQSLTALARSEQVTAPTMSKLVAELEAEGLAAKRAVAGDKRAVSIAATRKGRAAMLAGRKARLALLGERLAGFSAAELAALDRAAALMRRAAEGVR